MPHFTFEYSANLEGRVDLDRLCVAIRDTALSTGLFELGAVRVRGSRCDHYCVADNLSENAFLDLSVRIGVGRSAAQKKAIGDALSAMLEEELSDLFDTPHFALSIEVREIDPDLSWKRNAIHPRIRAMENK